MKRATKWLHVASLCVLAFLPSSLLAQCGGTGDNNIRLTEETHIYVISA